MMRRLVGIALVAMVALVATPIGATAATSPSPGAMTPTKVKAAGISLKYPSSWLLVPLTKKALAAQAKILSKKNPKLAAVLAATDVTDVLHFKLHAIDPATDGGQNVGVQFVEGLGSPSSLSDFSSKIIPRYKAAGATILDTKAVKVSGKTAYRIDLTLPVKSPDGSIDVRHLGQLLVPEGDSWASVNAVASNDDAGIALIDSILTSVRRV
jgi:hypothetical protein